MPLSFVNAGKKGFPLFFLAGWSYTVSVENASIMKNSAHVNTQVSERIGIVTFSDNLSRYIYPVLIPR
jgi:hypothetical protein